MSLMGTTSRSAKEQRRLPAEWEPQAAILLTWPHSGTDWKLIIEEVENTYFEMAKAILKTQNLVISCEDATRLEAVSLYLAPYAQHHQTTLQTFVIPADDTWTRDHGPIGIQENNDTILLDFGFNAWGDKFASDKDDKINSTLFQHNAFPKYEYRKVDMILEGGSIESDGLGSLLTTEKCLLATTRRTQTNHSQTNHTKISQAKTSKIDIEASLAQHLGIKRVMWLAHGHLSGDDTDAHIDTLARFVDAETICYLACNDPDDEHFEPLKQMAEELQAFRTLDDKLYRLIALPMPNAIYDQERRLPATYANFLITNKSVLLPIYGVEQDSKAIAILQECFPNREVIPINCNALIKQNGSLHCVTMQISQHANQ